MKDDLESELVVVTVTVVVDEEVVSDDGVVGVEGVLGVDGVVLDLTEQSEFKPRSRLQDPL